MKFVNKLNRLEPEIIVRLHKSGSSQFPANYNHHHHQSETVAPLLNIIESTLIIPVKSICDKKLYHLIVKSMAIILRANFSRAFLFSKLSLKAFALSFQPGCYYA